MPLKTLALAAYPDLYDDAFDPTKGLGDAPALAQAFAKRTKDLLS